MQHSELTEKQQAVVKEALYILKKHLQVAGFEFSSCLSFKHYVSLNLELREREVFSVLFLNNQNKLICYEEMFYGNIDSVNVHPREIARAALKHNAASVILAHNHPSGHREPSTADLYVTRKVKETLTLLDINVLDHFIIGGGDCLSFAERGLL